MEAATEDREAAGGVEDARARVEAEETSEGDLARRGMGKEIITDPE